MGPVVVVVVEVLPRELDCPKVGLLVGLPVDFPVGLPVGREEVRVVVDDLVREMAQVDLDLGQVVEVVVAQTCVVLSLGRKARS